MAIIVIIIGLYILVVSIRGQQLEFANLIKGDFSGTQSFRPFIFALLFLWMLGLYKPLAPVSKALMVLVMVVLFLKQGTGFFDQFNKQVGIT